MSNERITEDMVRERFKPFSAQGFVLEEQKSKNPRINNLLRQASKSGVGGGRPDFIVSHKDDLNFIMVVECKSDPSQHESKHRDRPRDFAVDGALLYASCLCRDFDVVALGVRGQSEAELKASAFLQLKGTRTAQPLLDGLRTPDVYKEAYVFDERTKHQRYEELLAYNRELSILLKDKKIQENKRSLLISAILIGLGNRAFAKSFDQHRTASALANNLVDTVISELSESDIDADKMEKLKYAYGFIKVDSALCEDKEFFVGLIRDIDLRVNSYMRTYEFYDVIGEFYIEFLRYANADKALGIVLTPGHMTELFCDLAYVNKNSVVFDNCCGTGGFLIAAMRRMIKHAAKDKALESSIKNRQVVGVEYDADIFSLACSNMIIHGDGKSNIHNDDCFSASTLIETIKDRFHPTVGLLNPPFKSNHDELEFVLNNLQGLEKNALCVALLPMQCALTRESTRMLKERIMRDHTLVAVVSLPDELFYNSKVSVITCAMVIKAHVPHGQGYQTYFGYWKDDGFIKRKYRGRVDGGGWKERKEVLLHSYRNRTSVPGLSVMQEVRASDEWCAEAYMETDYTGMKEVDFIEAVKHFVAHQFLRPGNEQAEIANLRASNRKTPPLSTETWRGFLLKDVFSMHRGILVERKSLKEGTTPYITRTAVNNGVQSHAALDESNRKKCHKGGAITIGAEGFTAFYQPHDFLTGNNITILRNADMSTHSALFVCCILNLAMKGRYNYGFSASTGRLSNLEIRLPAKDSGEADATPDWEFMDGYIKSLPYSGNLDFS